MDDSKAWSLERCLWLEGPDLYDYLLDPECLMAFPSVGVLRAANFLDSVKGAPRWASVEMTGQVIGRLCDAILVLGYTAEGRRDGAAHYRCHCTSTYRRDSDTWKLVQHQQTLAD